MNLTDLSKIDIKDLKKIDLAQVRHEVQTRPDILINVLLIGGTLFAIIFFYNAHGGKATKYKGEITQLKEKVDILKEQEKFMKELKDFKTSFPKPISSEQLVNTLTDWAAKRNIQIISFNPTENREEEFWRTSSMVINIVSDNYVDLLLFLKDIENSSYSVKIEKFTAVARDAGPANAQPIMEVIIKIQSVRLKDV